MERIEKRGGRMEQVEKEMKRLKKERKNIVEQASEGRRQEESVRQIKTIKTELRS